MSHLKMGRAYKSTKDSTYFVVIGNVYNSNGDDIYYGNHVDPKLGCLGAAVVGPNGELLAGTAFSFKHSFAVGNEIGVGTSWQVPEKEESKPFSGTQTLKAMGYRVRDLTLPLPAAEDEVNNKMKMFVMNYKGSVFASDEWDSPNDALLIHQGLVFLKESEAKTFTKKIRDYCAKFPALSAEGPEGHK